MCIHVMMHIYACTVHVVHVRSDETTTCIEYAQLELFGVVSHDFTLV